jgi:hypothetical protein
MTATQTTSEEHIGRTGAKRQTGSSANPRARLVKLISENQSSSEAEIYNLCWDEFKSNDSYTERPGHFYRTVFEYWFANNYRAILLDTPQRREMRASARESSVQLQTKIAESVSTGIQRMVNTKVKVALLDMMLPNGKQLKNCTGAECNSLSSEVGSFLSAVGKAVGAKKLVGKVLSEDQLRELYDAN